MNKTFLPIMNEPIVTVQQGKLRGIVEDSVLGSRYLAFKGIPFAAPPVGELRFRDPQPPASWSGIRDASQNRGICAQFDELPSREFVGSDDCLYLNVYTTSLTEYKPVMLWIHGGAFVQGNGNDTKTRPDYLVNKGIVLVSINYRLGALGFLNVGDETASGNQGLKDQVAALNWVRRNICCFGGDINNITLFGASAGGASVHLLMLSPLSKGLFHKAILQSGIATCNWAVRENQPEAKAFALASILGMNSKDPREVVEFLRTVSPAEIVEAQYKVLTPEEARIANIPFGPTIDVRAHIPFLPRPVRQLLNEDNDIPVMVGHTAHEYIMFFKDMDEEKLAVLYNDLPLYAKLLLYSQEPEKIARLTRRIKTFYFRNKRFTWNDVDSIIRCMSDIHFNIPIRRFADIRRKRKGVSTYLYQFSYVGHEGTITKMLNSDFVMTGASHVDDLSYLFYLPRCKISYPLPPAIGTKDRKMMECLTSMWTNFAKTGDPTPAINEYVSTIWNPITMGIMHHLDIGNDVKLLPVRNDYADILRELD